MSVFDVFFVVTRLANLLVYLIFLVCMVWDVDGPYWVLEDFGSDPMYRDLQTILWYKAIRAFFLIPGFMETCRTVYYTGVGYFTVLISIREMVMVLTSKVNGYNDFFKFYQQFSIIDNVLAVGISRAGFFCVTIVYFMFVQTMWMCICGWDYLEPTVYLFFATFGGIIIMGTLLFLPLVSAIGENIVYLPKVKQSIIRKRYCYIKSFKNHIDLKRSKALKPLRFTYGSYYPFGKSFARNVLNNVIQNLLSMVLLFDIHGKRHK